MPSSAIKKGSGEKQATSVYQANSYYYTPDAATQEIISSEYADLEFMIEQRNNTYPEFNDRTLLDFIDDNDKRLNCHVVPREAYDPPKEGWQSNVPLPVIRDKQEKILAGYSLDVPDMEVKAFVSDGGLELTDRAYIAKWLIKGSYMQEENSVVENFWESWECAARGTVIKYEGYLKTRAKQKFITNVDMVNGVVEYTEREVDIDDRCISYLVPIDEFYIWDFSIHDVQDQPKIAWVRYMDKGAFNFEFGKYKNADKVLYKSEMLHLNQETFYGKQRWWMDRVNDKEIEVICVYCKHKDKQYDSYRILANGVLILDAPLLWKKNGVKIYPFAKTVFKPFVNKQFFYGNSCPNVLAAISDSLDTTVNTMSDKAWRSMIPGLLIGNINRDAFDLEDEIITSSTRIPVADVNQVRPVPVEGITSGDVLFFNILSKLIDNFAPSLPAILGNKQATAREIVIANEKIDEIKSIYNAMMADLWRQKYTIRLSNIQLNYPQPRKIIDKNGNVKTVWRTYLIDNAELDPVTGERGTLAIKFMPLKKERSKIKEQEESDIQEEAFKMKGINYKRIICNTDYLTNGIYQITIIPTAVYRASVAQEQSLVLEKIDIISKYFPDLFVVNKKEYFTQLANAYQDQAGKYLKNLQQFEDAKKEMMAAVAPTNAATMPTNTTSAEQGVNAAMPALPNLPAVTNI